MLIKKLDEVRFFTLEKKKMALKVTGDQSEEERVCDGDGITPAGMETDSRSGEC